MLVRIDECHLDTAGGVAQHIPAGLSAVGRRAPLVRRGGQSITILGSFMGTRADMAEALAFAAEGKVARAVEALDAGALVFSLFPSPHGHVPERQFVGAGY